MKIIIILHESSQRMFSPSIYQEDFQIPQVQSLLNINVVIKIN